MPVPSTLADLSQTAGSNSPLGSESPTSTDDYLRAHASFLAYIRDGKQFTTEATLASGATADIGGVSSFYVRITGTTTITSFGTDGQGPRFLRFADALTLTHNSSTLILPGGANITTAAGDTCIATPITGGWVVSQYQRSAASNALVSGTATATTSGTSVDFTGIPSWVRRITVVLNAVSVSGTSVPIVQLGDSGGVETSAYVTHAAPSNGSGTAYSNGFGLFGSTTAGNNHNGALVLTLMDASSNLWVGHGVLNHTGDTNAIHVAAGRKSLSGTLDRIRLTTAGGVNTFDGGSVNILYE